MLGLNRIELRGTRFGLLGFVTYELGLGLHSREL